MSNLKVIQERETMERRKVSTVENRDATIELVRRCFDIGYACAMNGHNLPESDDSLVVSAMQKGYNCATSLKYLDKAFGYKEANV